MPGHEVVIIHDVETSTCPCGMGYEVWSNEVLEHNEGATVEIAKKGRVQKTRAGEKDVIVARCCHAWRATQNNSSFDSQEGGQKGAHEFGTLNYVFSVTYYLELCSAITICY